jgi:uncharacterized protein (TIGR02246 family)
MKFHFFSLIFCAGLLFLTSCKQAETTEAATTEAMPAEAAKPDMAAVKAEIQALENQWADAINKKDLAGLMAMYADDAVSMPDGAPTLTGKAAIQERQTKQFADAKGNITISFQTLDVFGDGDIVTEYGSSTEKDDKGNVVETGKYVATFKKTDGKYLCIREIYNSDKAAK